MSFLHKAALLHHLSIHFFSQMKKTNFTSNYTCPLCKENVDDIFFEIHQVPIHCNLLWPTQQEAIDAPRGDIKLGFCKECGHIFNFAFHSDIMEYTQSYENALHFSPRFQEYAKKLAEDLVTKHDLHHKELIEIGSGQGEFLSLLCEVGQNRGIGFDPSYRNERENTTSASHLTYIQDFYSEKYKHYQADFISCRHVLEHIEKPADFLNTVRKAIDNKLNSIVFFEVPNVLYTLRDLGIWDIIYEHCSYFNQQSLSYLFQSCGFNVQDVATSYEGQFLCIDALPANESSSLKESSVTGLESLAHDVEEFARRYQEKKKIWHHQLEEIAQNGKRVVVWGAGSKGVTFLNMLNIQDQIEYIIDINPRKHGMYVSGAGQKIMPKEFISDYRPEAVIVMNPIYAEEIQQMIESMGVQAEIMIA